MTSSLDADRLAILVHEVRSPVAALSAIAETVAEGEFAGAERGTLIRLAALACGAIERIVADASVVSIRPERVDVARLVEDVVAAHALRGAGVELSAAPEVPLVEADPLRLAQALDNLIVNALVHGAPDTSVAIAVAADTMVRIEVSDRGRGIPAGELERIFERRVRLQPDASAGTGLGLALARAIAEGHGGSLTVVSPPGTGTTFTLSLPFMRG